MKRFLEKFIDIVSTIGVAWLLIGSSFNFYEIAWGTGDWYDQFSRTWFIFFCAFIFLCITAFILFCFYIWRRQLFLSWIAPFINAREQLGRFRWIFWLVLLFLPSWFFQYTMWGLVFQKLYIRILIWVLVICFLTIISSQKDQFVGWGEFLISLVFISSVFSIVASLKYVNNYPFSLGWSEGNRLWDYSILFGSDLYIYPADKKIHVLLDFGRQFVGGLPFIFPNVTISIARLWVGFTLIIPYLLLGIATFRIWSTNKISWLIFTLWAFLFLKQGPIHAPLVLSAALIALAWRAPFWYAIPLVIGAGYFAETSRFTWIFAPGMWIFMLEFVSASFSDPKSVSTIWKRSLILGTLGIFGGFILPNLIARTATPSPTAITIPIAQPTPLATPTPNSITTSDTSKPNYFEFIFIQIKRQPLLWYRLLPNSTYRTGVLISLLIVAGPLLIILIYLSRKKIWFTTNLQKISILLPLVAFLIVGLVASTKIGGGGDLHNLDMFLIGLFFASVIALENGGREWLQKDTTIPLAMKIVIIFPLVISSVGPLFEMRSYTFGNDISRLRTLTDAPYKDTLEMLPTTEEINTALQEIQNEVDHAKLEGDVLFIDQRQLLTFGYATDVPLIPDYEKKILMNQALSANDQYFKFFYEDLAANRFSLIITEPLRTPIQDSSFQFGEENNAWVKWVAGPILCFYEPLDTLKAVKVQLLVPNKTPETCVLP